MITKDIYEYWANYVLCNPEKTNDINNRACAPYGGLVVTIHQDDVNPWIFFTQKGTDLWHRLDGPAVVERNQDYNNQFWVNDRLLTEEQFNKHPLVVEYKLNKLIKEVLNE